MLDSCRDGWPASTGAPQLHHLAEHNEHSDHGEDVRHGCRRPPAPDPNPGLRCLRLPPIACGRAHSLQHRERLASRHL